MKKNRENTEENLEKHRRKTGKTPKKNRENTEEKPEKHRNISVFLPKKRCFLLKFSFISLLISNKYLYLHQNIIYEFKNTFFYDFYYSFFSYF
jgi:hypothetical protein